MNWKRVFMGTMGAFSLGLFLISPQLADAAGGVGSTHNGNVTDHTSSGIASTHGGLSTKNVSSQGGDLHSAMVHVAEAESHLVQVRQGGNAHEILSARGSLHEAESSFIVLLATSSGVSVAAIKNLHGSGVSLAQIGYDLQMVRFPSSRAYINGHSLDVSGLVMGVDHPVHSETLHGSISDHHGDIVAPPAYSRDARPNNFNHQNTYDYHSSGGGMGGMH